MQKLFKNYQINEDRVAKQEFEEWKISEGTSAVKSSLRWTAAMILITILVDAFRTLLDNQSPTIKNCIFDNLYWFIGFLFFGALIAWTKNNKFLRKFNKERSNKPK